MEYIQHNWTTGETVTSNKLNNMEEGISDAAREINELDEDAIKMPDGEDGQILEKDSNAQGGVKWVDKSSTGTHVEANPTGEATETLEKIKIGEGIYEIPEDISSDMSFDKKLQTQANINNQESSVDGRFGYVVLQPEKADDDTATFAAQIANKPNTIFEIRDVFDLDGSVTIPANCVLKFNGGMLKNGNLLLNNTYIDSDGKCFGDNLTIDGTSKLKNKEIKLSWFCNEGDDCADVITNILNITYISNIYLDLKDIKISHPIVVGIRTRNIYGKRPAFSHISYDVTLQEMSTIVPTDDYSAIGYDKDAAFYFNEVQTGTITNLRINGSTNNASYKFGYGFYFDKGLVGGTLSYNHISHCYISGIVIYTSEDTTVSHNRIEYCATGIYCSSMEINESNILDMSSAVSKGPNNWITFEDCNIILCNYGFVGKTGSPTNFIRTGINHCSCYAIYVYNYNTININDCYLEGNGRSTFWIDENGLDGSLDLYQNPPVMCNHLQGAHLGEDGNTEIASGWGIKTSTTYRLRSCFCLIGYGTTNINNLTPSCRVFRTGVDSNSLPLVSNAGDNVAIGVDSFVYAIDGQKVNLSNITINPYNYGSPNFCKYAVISCWNNLIEQLFQNITFENVTYREVFYASRVQYSLPPFENRNASDINGNYAYIFRSVSTNVAGVYNDISKNCTFKKFEKGIPLYEPWYDENNSKWIIRFKIDKGYFTKPILLRWYMQVEEGSGSLDVKFAPTSYIYSSSATTYNIGGDLKEFNYVVNPVLISNDDFVLTMEITNSSGTTLTPLVSLLYSNSLDEMPKNSLHIEGYDDRYLPNIGDTTLMNNVASYASIYQGFKFFNTTLNKEVYFNGTKFVESDGASAGVLRVGTTANRPSGFDIYLGFIYYDRTLDCDIIAVSINSSTGNVAWKKADGNEAVAYGITKTGTGFVLSNASTSILVGKPYITEISPADGYSSVNVISVTVANKDVTSLVYDSSTNIIYIPAAAGLIVIRANGVV